MASPQLEHGYARMANEILEALMRAPLNGSQLRIVLAIVRENYGRNGGQKTSFLPMAKLSALTLLHVSTVKKEVLQLSKFKVLIRDFNGQKQIIGLQNNYESWDFPRAETGSQPTTGSQSATGSQPTTKPVANRLPVTHRIHIGKKEKKKHAASPHADPRFRPIVDFFFQRVRDITGSKPDWDGADGNRLKAWLKENQEVNGEEFTRWLENAFQSTKSYPLPRGFRMTEFIRHRMKYMNGPLYDGKQEPKNTKTQAELYRGLRKGRHGQAQPAA